MNEIADSEVEGGNGQSDGGVEGQTPDTKGGRAESRMGAALVLTATDDGAKDGLGFAVDGEFVDCPLAAKASKGNSE